MTVEDEFTDVLQNIEFVVVRFYREDRSVLDLHILDAYNAVIKAITRAAQSAEHQLPANTDSRVRRAYEEVLAICKWRMASADSAGRDKDANMKPDDMISCLKRLKKSVERWNGVGGRQGYLNYIEQFIP